MPTGWVSSFQGDTWTRMAREIWAMARSRAGARSNGGLTNPSSKNLSSSRNLSTSPNCRIFPSRTTRSTQNSRPRSTASTSTAAGKSDGSWLRIRRIELRPPADAARRYPVLLNVHGGPFTQYGDCA
jgi:dipeptidyl aminopeptidase/acylaminoacyl peptidase